MTRRFVHSRALTLLLAGGIALGAVLTHGKIPTAEANHIPQHQAVDLAVKLLPSEDIDWYVRPGKRVELGALMTVEEDGVERPRLVIYLPPTLVKVTVENNYSDICTVKTFSDSNTIPGTRIECEGFQGSVNNEQPGLLWDHQPRSIRFRATVPNTEGQHKVEAIVEPTKYWDDIPGNNRALRILTVTNTLPPPMVVTKPVDSSLVVAPGAEIAPKPGHNPCIVNINDC